MHQEQQPTQPEALPLDRWPGLGPAHVQAEAGLHARLVQPGSSAAEVAKVLEEHLAVCNQLLALAQKESEALKSTSAFPSAEARAERKALLNGLKSALNGVVHGRTLWQQSGTETITRDPRVARLVPVCLDTIMRVLVLDRENEQQLLRRGLLPAQALPAAEQGRPHYVAGLYQRHGQNPSAEA